MDPSAWPPDSASFVVPGTARALHPFASRKHLPSKLSQLREIDGRSAVRTRGQGTEFDSLRDYVDGDDVRSIDWRATARRQHLVVRTWQPEQHRRIVIVLDSSRTSAGRVGDAPRLDAGMDAALLLAALAEHARDRVEVVVGDRQIRARVGGGQRGTASLRDIVAAFAPIDPALVEADWPQLLSAVSARGSRRALVVIITPLESAAIEFGLLPSLPGLVPPRVVIASVADLVSRLRADAPTSRAYAAAAASAPSPSGGDGRRAPAARRIRPRRGHDTLGRARRLLPAAQVARAALTFPPGWRYATTPHRRLTPPLAELADVGGNLLRGAACAQ